MDQKERRKVELESSNLQRHGLPQATRDGHQIRLPSARARLRRVHRPGDRQRAREEHQRRRGPTVHHARRQRGRLRPELPHVSQHQVAQSQAHPSPFRQVDGHQLHRHAQRSRGPTAIGYCQVRAKGARGATRTAHSGDQREQEATKGIVIFLPLSYITSYSLFFKL